MRLLDTKLNWAKVQTFSSTNGGCASRLGLAYSVLDALSRATDLALYIGEKEKNEHNLMFFVFIVIPGISPLYLQTPSSQVVPL